jgi:PAS domain S-box-containing protein
MISGRPLANTVYVDGSTDGRLSSGDPIFTFDAGLRILSWNRAAESLTGVPEDEAIGRHCWEVLGGHEDPAGLVCHAGCSYARLVQEGYPVRSHEVEIKTAVGPKRVVLSTIALRSDRTLFAHLMLEAGAPDAPDVEPESNGPADLTPRQREILGRLAEGVPAKVIARDLGLSETTVRNHIRAILLELDCHSQLAAVAKARRAGVLR